MHPQGDEMNALTSSQSDEVFLEHQTTAKRTYNPINAATTPRLPTAVSYDSLKPKHFHLPVDEEEVHPVQKATSHSHVNMNPESGVDHSSLLEEIPMNPEDIKVPLDTDKSSWYSRWEDKKSLDEIEEDERRKEEKRRKTEVELRKLKCGLGKIILKEDKEEELRMIHFSLDPRLTSRSPNANIKVHRKMRYSTPVASSPSRIIKEARKSLSENYPLANNGNVTIIKTNVADLNANPASDGASSRGSSESGSNFGIHESLCNPCVVQSLPDITGQHNILPYEILKTTNSKRPKGVDKSLLERYLHPNEFQRIFSMNREQFYRLPHWRQLDLKKKVHLF